MCEAFQCSPGKSTRCASNELCVPRSTVVKILCMLKCTNVLLKKKLLELSYILKKNIYICIPHNFLVINVCNQGKTLCSPCIINYINWVQNWEVIISHYYAWSQKWNIALGVYIEGHVKNLISENSCLLWYNAVWVGECFLKYCRNICNHSPSGTVSYPRRCESPDTTARTSSLAICTV